LLVERSRGDVGIDLDEPERLTGPEDHELGQADDLKGDLPALGAPRIEMWTQRHATERRRLFVS